MSFRRKKIRKQLAKILKGRTDAKENVRVNRSETNWQENLPAINIYLRSEDVEPGDEAPRRLVKTLLAEVEIIQKGKDGEDLNDKLDDLGEQVEQLLSVDDSLGSTVDDIVLRSTEIETEATGEEPIGSLRLTYAIRYHDYYPRDQKGQGVTDLNEIDTQWQVGHHDDEPDMAEADRAKDKIVLPD